VPALGVQYQSFLPDDPTYQVPARYLDHVECQLGRAAIAPLRYNDLRSCIDLVLNPRPSATTPHARAFDDLAELIAIHRIVDCCLYSTQALDPSQDDDKVPTPPADDARQPAKHFLSLFIAPLNGWVDKILELPRLFVVETPPKAFHGNRNASVASFNALLTRAAMVVHAEAAGAEIPPTPRHSEAELAVILALCSPLSALLATRDNEKVKASAIRPSQSSARATRRLVPSERLIALHLSAGSAWPRVLADFTAREMGTLLDAATGAISYEESVTQVLRHIRGCRAALGALTEPEREWPPRPIVQSAAASQDADTDGAGTSSYPPGPMALPGHEAPARAPVADAGEDNAAHGPPRLSALESPAAGIS